MGEFELLLLRIGAMPDGLMADDISVSVTPDACESLAQRGLLHEAEQVGQIRVWHTTAAGLLEIGVGADS